MFNFKFEPKVTRELLLSKHSEETYMSHYLGIDVRKGLFVSPLRADKHKTCSFFKGKSGVLYFKDFATNDCLDFTNVVMKKYNCDYYKALNIIAKDFGITNSTIKPPVVKIQPKFEAEQTTIIQCEIKDFSEAELKWWNSFGITKKILDKYRIFSINTVFLNGNIYAKSTQHCPIYGYYFGKKENIEQWRIYMPKRKECRFIGNCSTKVIQGYHQLPKNGKLLIITKSMKDVMCLKGLGLTAIAPNSETQFISDKLLEDLHQRFNQLIVIYDNDLPGIQNMCKLKKKYPDLNYFFIPRNLSKDVSDLYCKYGRDKTIELIKEFFKNYKWRKSR